jgi:surface antigen
MRLRAGIIATVLLLSAAGGASAQINPFRNSKQGQGLTPEDTKALFDTTDALNRASPLHVGDSRDWSNPASGASGHVTVRRVYTSKGMTCHALRNTMRANASAKSTTYDTNWCRVPSGDWKIVS